MKVSPVGCVYFSIGYSILKSLMLCNFPFSSRTIIEYFLPISRFTFITSPPDVSPSRNPAPPRITRIITTPFPISSTFGIGHIAEPHPATIE
jgi:hypothetical protein